MQKKIRNSLTMKIFFITSLLLILVCGLTYKFIAYVTPISYETILTSSREEDVQELINTLSQTTIEEGKKLIEKFKIRTGSMVTLTDKEETIVMFSNGSVEVEEYFSPKEDLEIGFESSLQEGRKEIYTTKENAKDNSDITDIIPSVGNVSAEKYAEIASNITTAEIYFINSEEKYILTVTTIVKEVKEINQVTQALGKILPWLCVVIFIISLLGSYIYSLYITKPIVKISKIAKSMAQLEFGYQCEEKRKDEIGILGQSLNQLSEKLSTTLKDLKNANSALTKEIENEKRLEKIRQEFFAAASHELKTPLTIIKGQVEGMLYQVGVYKDRDTYLQKMGKVVENMEHIVKEILTISKIHSISALIKKEKVLLIKLIEKQRKQYLELMEKKQISFQTSIEESLEIKGNKALFEHVFSNLYSNAVFYSPPYAQIRVTAKEVEEKIFFSIENTGVHIPEERIEKLTDAFYRLETSRNRKTGGSGLGLYIVKMILEEEQAEFKIKNTEEGVSIEIFFT